MDVDRYRRRGRAYGYLECKLLSVGEGQVQAHVEVLLAQVGNDEVLRTVALVLDVNGCDLRAGRTLWLLADIFTYDRFGTAANPVEAHFIHCCGSGSETWVVPVPVR